MIFSINQEGVGCNSCNAKEKSVLHPDFENDKNPEKIIDWLLHPPVTASSATLIIRLMTESAFSGKGF